MLQISNYYDWVESTLLPKRYGIGGGEAIVESPDPDVVNGAVIGGAYGGGRGAKGDSTAA
jgi:hypothetical protein